MIMTQLQFDKNRIAQSFGKATATYDQAAVLQRVVGDKLLCWLAQIMEDFGCTPPQLIVDVGAGTGVMTAAIHREWSHHQVVGIDIAAEMVKHAQCCFCSAVAGAVSPRRSSLSFVCADADHLPFDTASVDVVISNLMLQWSPSLAATFAEVWRVLKPGGHFLFTTLGNGTLHELRSAWAQTDGAVAPHVSNFIDKEILLHELCESKRQFAVRRCLVHNYQRLFQRLDDLMRELQMLGAHNLRQDRHTGLSGKAKFVQLRRAYEDFRRADGFLPATYEVYYVDAQKE
jgi:malonyl-CoA O-methyltransferase